MSPFRFGDGRDWFFEKRFGLFVHWGLYAIPAWHEQVQWRREVPRREYQELIHQFNPVRYNPDDWLDLAEEAGMEYVCFTTKHHDGFCLWDTGQTKYNVMHSPYGRDVLEMLSDACQRREFPLCLYYSVADWHHPNYPNQGRTHELAGPEEGDEPDQERYLDFLRAQVRELCTGYGELGGFWWDMNVMGVEDPSINALVRELQPNAVINNRGFDEGDFGTPEREADREAEQVLAFGRPTEACQSVGMESWGFKADEDFYTDKFLMQSMDKFLAKGSNYLLNVGPAADGTIPEVSGAKLRRIGTWFENVREAFCGAEPASAMTVHPDVLLTKKGDVVYVHLFKEPMGDAVVLKPMDRMPEKATVLNTGEEVEVCVDMTPRLFRDKKAYLRLRGLPVEVMKEEPVVVKLE